MRRTRRLISLSTLEGLHLECQHDNVRSYYCNSRDLMRYERTRQASQAISEPPPDEASILMVILLRSRCNAMILLNPDMIGFY